MGSLSDLFWDSKAPHKTKRKTTKDAEIKAKARLQQEEQDRREMNKYRQAQLERRLNATGSHGNDNDRMRRIQ